MYDAQIEQNQQLILFSSRPWHRMVSCMFSFFIHISTTTTKIVLTTMTGLIYGCVWVVLHACKKLFPYTQFCHGILQQTTVMAFVLSTVPHRQHILLEMRQIEEDQGMCQGQAFHKILHYQAGYSWIYSQIFSFLCRNLARSCSSNWATYHSYNWSPHFMLLVIDNYSFSRWTLTTS